MSRNLSQADSIARIDNLISTFRRIRDALTPAYEELCYASLPESIDRLNRGIAVSEKRLAEIGDELTELGFTPQEDCDGYLFVNNPHGGISYLTH